MIGAVRLMLWVIIIPHHERNTHTHNTVQFPYGLVAVCCSVCRLRWTVLTVPVKVQPARSEATVKRSNCGTVWPIKFQLKSFGKRERKEKPGHHTGKRGPQCARVNYTTNTSSWLHTFRRLRSAFLQTDCVWTEQLQDVTEWLQTIIYRQESHKSFPQIASI